MTIRALFLSLSLVFLGACTRDANKLPPRQDSSQPAKAETVNPPAAEQPASDKKAADDKTAQQQQEGQTETQMAQVPVKNEERLEADLATEEKTDRLAVPPTHSSFAVNAGTGLEAEAKVEQTETAVPNEKPIVSENSPLFVRLVAANDVDAILKHIADGTAQGLDTPDSMGRIPMHYARTAEMMALLWDRQVVLGTEEGWSGRYEVVVAAQDVADRFGQYPLHTIAARGDRSAIRFFNAKWCGWWSNEYLYRQDVAGRTPLHVATIAQQLPAVTELLACDSYDTGVTDQFKRTATHYAADTDNFLSGLMLLYRTLPSKFHERNKFRDINGEFPMDIVIRRQNDEAIAQLRAIFED